MSDPAIINRVYKKDEVIFAPDGKAKVGDGRRHYNDLPFTVGVPGPIGPAGLDGASVAISGPTGPAGPIGPTGPTGPAVTSFGASGLTGALNVAQMTTTANDQAAILPINLYAKGITVKTTGTPADIATITVPAGTSRWHLLSASTSVALAETASGTLAAASFTAWTAAGGTGTQLTSAFLGPTNATTLVSISANSLSTFTTSRSIVIRQNANSVNAGTMSFYFTLFPTP
jgi:hypothetical protein